MANHMDTHMANNNMAVQMATSAKSGMDVDDDPGCNFMRAEEAAVVEERSMTDASSREVTVPQEVDAHMAAHMASHMSTHMDTHMANHMDTHMANNNMAVQMATSAKS